MGINVLSLCDGMSCGQIALKELNFDVGGVLCKRGREKCHKDYSR